MDLLKGGNSEVTFCAIGYSILVKPSFNFLNQCPFNTTGSYKPIFKLILDFL